MISRDQQQQIQKQAEYQLLKKVIPNSLHFSWKRYYVRTQELIHLLMYIAEWEDITLAYHSINCEIQNDRFLLPCNVPPLVTYIVDVTI